MRMKTLTKLSDGQLSLSRTRKPSRAHTLSCTSGERFLTPLESYGARLKLAGYQPNCGERAWPRYLSGRVPRSGYRLNRNGICFAAIGKPTTFKITLTVYHRVSAQPGKEGSSRYSSLVESPATEAIYDEPIGKGHLEERTRDHQEKPKFDGTVAISGDAANEGEIAHEPKSAEP